VEVVNVLKPVNVWQTDIAKVGRTVKKAKSQKCKNKEYKKSYSSKCSNANVHYFVQPQNMQKLN